MWVEWVERVGRCHCPGFVLANLGYGQIATCGGRQPAEPTEPTTCQEAEVLDDVPGALWTRGLLEELRWPVGKPVPDLSRIVVAIEHQHPSCGPHKQRRSSSAEGRAYRCEADHSSL